MTESSSDMQAAESPPRTNHKLEGTRIPGLIMFYASCAAVSLGAGLAAMGFLLFTDKFYVESGLTMFLRVTGVILVVVGVVGAFVFLGRARR
jgi:hypothetical protein